jgi:hypothetical protein
MLVRAPPVIEHAQVARTRTNIYLPRPHELAEGLGVGMKGKGRDVIDVYRGPSQTRTVSSSQLQRTFLS